MNRRGFFGGLVAAVAGLSLKPTEPSYTYDWNGSVLGRENHWTDDPKFAGVDSPYGIDVQRVYLAGEDVSEKLITAVKTGPDGWVQYLVIDSDNKPVIDYDTGEMVKMRVGGPIRYEYRG